MKGKGSAVEMIARTIPGRVKRPLADRLMLNVARTHAQIVLSRLLRSAEQAVATQEEVLRRNIRRNAESAFGRDHGFRDIRTYADFARQVPILTYEHIEPYIERVKNGEVEAMFGRGQNVHMFAKTSGTTDRPKYIPVTSHFLREYRRGWNAFGVKVLMDHPGCYLRNIVQVTSPMDEEHAPCGIPCGAITGLMARTQKRLVRRYYVVPMDVAYVTDATARYYCVMRYAAPADVAFMITASPATQLRLARTADQHAEQIIRDVRDGTLWDGLEIPSDLRRRLEARLRPDPAAGERLDRIARRTGRLLPKDFWNLGFLANWTGGTMGLYLRDFPEYFGRTPVRDVGLLASEGRMSIPVEDWTPSGILNVADNFYEFIPAEEYESPQRTVLRAHEVEEGREYFILITTSAGFYRYDMGDRVRVTGWNGQAPMIEFLHKGVHTCSLTGEKLTEQQVVLAFDAVAQQFDLAGRNFVLAPQWSEVPYYRLHIERCEGLERAAGTLGGGTIEAVRGPDGAGTPGGARSSGGPGTLGGVSSVGAGSSEDAGSRAGNGARAARGGSDASGGLSAELRAALAAEFERHLTRINIEYASKRASGRLGPVQLNVLPPEWLAKYDHQESTRQRASNEQYKHRYLLSQIGADGEFP